jgi:acetyl-CoA synthetase
MDIKLGSMGRPIPGIEAAIVRKTEQGQIEVIEAPDTKGILALKAGWPSMFTTYLHMEERYRGCFIDGWYLTGDLARRDAEDYFWFEPRRHGIKSSGHLIGHIEVEKVLLEHPAVAGAAVIGKPDLVAHELVKAIVTLKPGHSPSTELRNELMALARRRLGAAMMPREIEFTEPESRHAIRRSAA